MQADGSIRLKEHTDLQKKTLKDLLGKRMCRHVEVGPAKLTVEFSYSQGRLLVTSVLAFSHLELEPIVEKESG